VIGHNILPDNPMPLAKTDLEIRQITISDYDDIGEMTEIEEWQIPKLTTLKLKLFDFRNGNRQLA
jgi:hypothetical protein